MMKFRGYLLCVIAFLWGTSAFSQIADTITRSIIYPDTIYRNIIFRGNTVKKNVPKDTHTEQTATIDTVFYDFPELIIKGRKFVTPHFKVRSFLDSLVISAYAAKWEAKNKFGVNVNEATFTNWNAGGSNSLSIMLNAYVNRTLKGENIRWKNELIMRYGLNAQKDQKLRKTDDHLEINSTFGFRPDTLSSWFYSAKMTFKTQFDKGFDYPDRTHSISSFLAPAYLFYGVGAEFGKDSNHFSLYLSPATLKTTFVADQRLANQGAFGVSSAIYDDNDNLLKKGKRTKTEFGFLLTNDLKKKVAKNIELFSRLSLYSDYLNDFGNIDVDWKVDLEFRVNKYVLAKIGSHLLYDNDTKIIETNEAGDEFRHGAKAQWKQQLGIGITVEI